MSFMPIMAPNEPNDFWTQVSQNAIPALFTSLVVKDPNTSGMLESMIPFYQAQAQRAQALQQAYAGSVQRAEGMIGAMPTPGEAAGSAATDTRIQLANAQQQAEREMQARGVKPGSGADMAAYGASGALGSAAVVNNANTAGQKAAMNRATAEAAIPGLYAAMPGESAYNAAGMGMKDIISGLDAGYNNKVRNAMAAFKPLNPLTDSVTSRAPSVIKYYYDNNNQGGGSTPVQQQEPMKNAMGLPLGGDPGE
jgi:hypothetical protein